MIPLDSAGALLLLALTDSLSFGTLLVPVWLLMTPGRIRIHRILVYLATVTISYFIIGVLLMAGGQLAFDRMSEFLRSPAALTGQFVIGAALLAASFMMDTKAARERAAARSARSESLRKWRERAMRQGAAASLIGLALTAVLVEVASMLPYIVATGIITTQTTAWPAALAVLAAYCGVMIAPALVLTSGRVLAKPLVEEPLRRLDGWITTHARSTTLWIMGIAGFFLAATAIQGLGWI